MAASKSNQRVVDFLEENKVNKEWQTFILNDPAIRSALATCLLEIVENQERYPSFNPDRDQILRALSYQPPNKIKAIVIGQDPIPGDWATGLAFSLPPDARSTVPSKDLGRERDWVRGVTLEILHDVLCCAGFLEEGKEYDCCAEIWAERGVLLWNAALTYHEPLTEETGSQLKEDETYVHWVNFGKLLLKKLLTENYDRSIPVLCMGAMAKEIGVELEGATLCDHPVNRSSPEDFLETGLLFFRKVHTVDSGLFRLEPKESEADNK